jgi:hypothetical protein
MEKSMHVRSRAVTAVLAAVTAVAVTIITAAPAAAVHYDCMVGETRMQRYQEYRDAALERGDTEDAKYWDNEGAEELARYEAAGC